MNIPEIVKDIKPYIIKTRRHIHEYPELSGQEFETQKFIIEELAKFGIEGKKCATTSVLAIIKGQAAGKTVALRADIDALPITEQSKVEYSSKNKGVMHACGHDAHTAMLLGAAKILAKHKELIHGEIRLIFQEAEETFSGARKVICDGGIEGVDAIFGMHGMPLKTGTYDIHSGYRMAGCDTIYISFEGVSGHGSSPHLAKDTIPAACSFVLELQRIVTKCVNAQDPVVLSVGKFDGGTKANIIAKYTNLDVSMRYFNTDVRKKVHELIKKQAHAIEIAHDIKVSVKIEESALSLYNDEYLTKIAQAAAGKIYGQNKNIELPKFMGSEDIPFYFQHTQGCYAFLGYLSEEKGSVYFPHHEKFNIDEDYLGYGTALYIQFALDFLNTASYD